MIQYCFFFVFTNLNHQIQFLIIIHLNISLILFMNFVLTNQMTINLGQNQKISQIIPLTQYQYIIIGKKSLYLYNINQNHLVKRSLTKKITDSKKLSDTHIVVIQNQKHFDKLLIYDSLNDTFTQVYKVQNKNKQEARIETTYSDNYILRYIQKQGKVTNILFFIGQQNNLILKSTLAIKQQYQFLMRLNDGYTYATSLQSLKDGEIKIKTHDIIEQKNRSIELLGIAPDIAYLQYIKQLKNKNIIVGFNCNPTQKNNFMSFWQIYNQNNVKLHRFYEGIYNIFQVIFINQQQSLIGYIQYKTKQSTSKKIYYPQQQIPERLLSFQAINYKNVYKEQNKKHIQNYIEWNNPSDIFQKTSFIDFKEQGSRQSELTIRNRIIVDKVILLVHLTQRSGIQSRFGQKIVQEAVKLIMGTL